MISYRQLLFLLVVAFLLRFGMIFFWTARFEGPFFFGDSDSYWTLGRCVAFGEPYDYGGMKIMRTPGYPVLLAPLFAIFGENPPVFAARLESCFFGTITVGLVALLAGLLFRDRSVAFLAGTITALDPGNILTSVLVLSEAPFCALIVLQTICWVRMLEKNSYRWALLCGGIAAASVYVRPSWLHFVPFAIVFWFLSVLLKRNYERFYRRLFLHAAVFATLFAALLPWGLRNRQVCGHFVLTSLQTGASLYDGLSPDATGASDMRFVERFHRAETESPSEDPARETFEYRLDQRMKTASLDWARSHPDRVAALVGVKFVRMWNLWPNEPSFSSLPVRIVVGISFVPILLGALGGIVLTLRRGFPFMLLWIPAVYFTLLHVIFVSSLRYRIPAMLFFAILASYFFVFLYRRFRGENGEKFLSVSE